MEGGGGTWLTQENPGVPKSDSTNPSLPHRRLESRDGKGHCKGRDGTEVSKGTVSENE